MEKNDKDNMKTKYRRIVRRRRREIKRTRDQEEDYEAVGRDNELSLKWLYTDYDVCGMPANTDGDKDVKSAKKITHDVLKVMK